MHDMRMGRQEVASWAASATLGRFRCSGPELGRQSRGCPTWVVGLHEVPPSTTSMRSGEIVKVMKRLIGELDEVCKGDDDKDQESSMRVARVMIRRMGLTQ